MAICNLFRSLSKKTGNVMMFSQYSEDLTQCFTQHDNYDVIPSRFVALNIDYSKLNGSRIGATALTGDLNVDLPTYMQNYFENGCAWLRGNHVDESWNPEDWTPDVHSNLFWNFLVESGLITLEQKTVQDEQGLDTQVDTFPEVKYVGDIDIHSYESRDGVGYSEIYCYIPNAAEETYYQVSMPNKDIDTWSHLVDTKDMIEGYVDDDTNILGTLSMELTGETKYFHTQNFGAVFTEPLEETNVENARLDYDAYPVGTDMFKFNTIVVLYDIMIKDRDANITTAYKNVPMAMFLTGLINQGGTVSNEVQKYSNCDDAYGAGTSYGLRICTRYMVTPNATTILTSEADIADQYAGFSRAMDKMAESQDMMNTILADVVNRSQDLKDHLAMFKNYRVNIPYVIYINENGEKVPYWFVNGKNTGERVNHPGKDGKDGVIPEIRKVDGVYYWFVNGTNTGVVAEGTPGVDGFDGQYWFNGTALTHIRTDRPGEHVFEHDGISQKVGDFYINTDTGYIYVLKLFDGQTLPQWFRAFCLKGVKGDDGETPAARNNPDDGNNLWWYVGNTPVCRAQAYDGKSILCLSSAYLSDIGLKVGFDSSQCNPGDVVIYVGKDGTKFTKYDVYVIEEETFVKGTVSCNVATKQGNIQGKHITNVVVTECKKSTNVTLNMSNGDTMVIRSKRNFISTPRYSSLQRTFAHWDDVVYYRPGDLMWLEIPYTYNVVSSVGGSVVFEIIPSWTASGTSGYKYIFKNNKNGTEIPSKGYREFTSGMQFRVSAASWNHMADAYGKFRRLGRLHLYVMLEDVMEAPKIAGLLYAKYNYDDIDNLKWRFDGQDKPVIVQRHGLAFSTPTSWSRISNGTLGAEKGNFSNFHRDVVLGRHSTALTQLIGFMNGTPLYQVDANHGVCAKVWVKMPLSREHGSEQIMRRQARWQWLEDKYIKNDGRIGHRVDWDKLPTLFDSRHFTNQNRRKYLYVALFDKVGAEGYLYKITSMVRGNHTTTTLSDLRIGYQGRINYLKKAK